MDRSKSLAWRRLRISHAIVRSTTQRLGSSLIPLAAPERLIDFNVQVPMSGRRARAAT
jgi:hypothetical protein